MNKYLITFSVIIIAFGSRYYKISEPNHVCWDETHFGKMGSWYINRTFFFDVHPPLGKMLIALSGYLSGYDGKFAFEKPGDKYDNVSYVGMRFFCASLGASIIPMSFETIEEMTHSLRASILAAIFLLCDVGLITLTQYILLDPILLFFISGSLLGTAKMAADSISIFSKTWWFWHLFTGIMLSCCISVKFVGLFTILFVGLCTVIDLWTILGDLNKSMEFFGKYFLAKALTLIIWPIIVYSIIFYIHLQILNKSGNGDGFYSTAFQSQLQGNSMFNVSMPQKIAYGSIITLKNHKIGGGYLHSHYHLYPEDVGVKQQQVTTYTYKDDNNKWLIKKFDENYARNIEIVKNGDLIRLEHILTKRNLHSHNHHAPLTKKQFQVTGYGENGTGDANDVWKVVLIDGHDDEEIKIINDRIQLIHFLQSCVLTTTGKQLPKWAFEQQEITCNPNLRDSNSMWNIEENEFEKLEKVNVRVYAPNFLHKFLESHAVMLKGNAGLKPKEGEVTSKPWQWPLNLKGQFFSGSDHRIYLLGNPIIWWLNLLLLIVFIIRYTTNAVYEQRNNWKNNQNKHIKVSFYLFLGWCLHYLPFYLMSRILYYHHYYPALIFNSLLSAVVLNQIVEEIIIMIPTMSFVVKHILNAIIVSVIVYSFIQFSPLSYGMKEMDQLQHLKWLESWEF